MPIEFQCDLRCLKRNEKSCCYFENCEFYDESIGCKLGDNRPKKCKTSYCYNPNSNVAH